MQRITASEFERRCIEIIDQVHETGKEVVITKNGVPVAILQVYREKSQILPELDANVK